MVFDFKGFKCRLFHNCQTLQNYYYHLYNIIYITNCMYVMYCIVKFGYKKKYEENKKKRTSNFNEPNFDIICILLTQWNVFFIIRAINNF